jgi:thiamine transport system permease protein
MVGLGSLLGLLRFAPDLIASPVLLPMAHATLVLPVVVRVLLPSMRALPDDLEEQAATLGLGPWRRWSLVRWPMLRPAAVVAAGLALAFSLGEFGASWILVRSTGSTTLAVLVDAWLARPGFDATTRPAAMAVASVLGVLAAAVMLTVERWRDDRMGGGL